MQGRREHACDSRGRPVRGLYVRGGRFIAGARVNGRWIMKNLGAVTLTGGSSEEDDWACARFAKELAAATIATLLAARRNFLPEIAVPR